MTLHALLEALQSSPLGAAIAESQWIFPTIETIHVLALSLVAGTILIVDLRLIGLASRDRPFTAISGAYLPWTWVAFALAACSGSLLFVSRAADYAAIPAFAAKFIFMGLAGLNMLAFHLMSYRRVGGWDAGAPPAGARAAGALSILFWAAVIVMGRRVGFSL